MGVASHAVEYGCVTVTAIIGIYPAPERLAQKIVGLTRGSLLTSRDFREHVGTSHSRSADEAQARIAAGELLPPPLAANIWREMTRGHNRPVVTGFPREVEELIAYEKLAGAPVSIIHVQPSRALLASLQAEHPGVSNRVPGVRAAIVEHATSVGEVLGLDGTLTGARMLELVVSAKHPCVCDA